MGLLSLPRLVDAMESKANLLRLLILRIGPMSSQGPKGLTFDLLSFVEPSVKALAGESQMKRKAVFQKPTDTDFGDLHYQRRQRRQRTSPWGPWLPKAP